MTALTAIIVFVLGTMIGSFLNVVIYRLPRRESLVRPRSRCPNCGAPIAAWDNIPVVSFLLLQGRCRSCGARISWRYPLVETAAGLLLLAVWLRSGSWVTMIGAGLFALALVAIFFIDLEHQIIPDAISLPGIIIGLVAALLEGRFFNGLLAAVGAGLFFFVTFHVSLLVLRREGMGFGDVKMAAMMGAFLGWPAIAVALFVAFLLGSIVGVALIAAGLRSRRQPIPFGPALALGGLVALFFAAPIVTWYVRW